MDCRREAQSGNGPSGGPPPPGLAQKQACLLLSLIVLVWNVGATGRHFLFADPPGSPEEIAGGMLSAPAAGVLPAGDCGASLRPGPLTVKQNYLLGGKVDINRATLAEIGRLPGISGPVAASIVETRKRLGGFRRAVDLLKVKGIKQKRLKKILPFLVEFPNN